MPSESAESRREPNRFTHRELDIMSVLWRRGSGTVAEVRDVLGEDVGYTTVLKMLQILEAKNAVRHEEGRAGPPLLPAGRIRRRGRQRAQAGHEQDLPRFRRAAPGDAGREPGIQRRGD